MNVWDYFDREAKKARCASGNLTEKVAKATGKHTCAVAPCIDHHTFSYYLCS